MFGILYLISNLIGGTASGLKGAVQNAESREQGEKLYRQGKNPFAFYVDRKGVTRLIDTNEPAEIDHDYLTGDVWLCTGIPSRRVKNLSEAWRIQYYNELRRHPITNKTTVNDIRIKYKPSRVQVDWDENNFWTIWCYAYGQWFKDLRTGDLYVKRTINCDDNHRREFYMSIKDGYLVRITEWQYERDIENGRFDEDYLKEFIRKFNETRVMPKKDDPDYKWEMFYYDNQHDCCTKWNADERELMGRLAPRL